ncbi:MAG: hypothetical protein WB439_14365 [Acidobacteriaceae bacterium]
MSLILTGLHGYSIWHEILQVGAMTASSPARMALVDAGNRRFDAVGWSWIVD